MLNGLGMRKVTIIKVYVGGLYLPAKSKDAAAIMAADAPRAIRMEFVRDVDKGRLTGGFREGFEKNAARVSRVAEGELREVPDVRRRPEEGRRDDVHVRAGRRHGDQHRRQGRRDVRGKEFADALFSLWLGPVPPSGELRKGCSAVAMGAARCGDQQNAPRPPFVRSRR